MKDSYYKAEMKPEARLESSPSEVLLIAVSKL